MKLNVVNGIAFVLGILLIIFAIIAGGSLLLPGILFGLAFLLAGAWMARRAARRG